MSKTRKLIEAAVQKKPLDVKEVVEELMQEKVRGVLAGEVDSFDPLEEELTEEQEMEEFFAAFHEEYGHLPEDEQEKIMEELMAEIEDEEALSEDEEKFMEMFEEAFGELPIEEQEQLMDEILHELDEEMQELEEGEYEADQNVSAFISKASAKIQTKAASGTKGKGDPMKTAPKKQPSNKLPDVK